MLSREEIEDIEAELPVYERKSGACIAALKVVQKHRGWVSDEAIQEIAEYLGMNTAEVDGVATFYNLIFRKQVGRNVILLCDSVSCWICGYRELHAHVKRRLGIDFGQTTYDGAFTLLPVACLGACDRAPVLMVNDETHLDVTPEGLERILETHRKERAA